LPETVAIRDQIDGLVVFEKTNEKSSSFFAPEIQSDSKIDITKNMVVLC
jgi:hypothetical protein